MLGARALAAMATSFSMASLQAALPSPTSSFRCAASPAPKALRIRVTSARAVQCLALQSFSGLSRECNPLRLAYGAGGAAATSFSSLTPSNGSRWFAMRHGRRVPRLGRPADQRKALLRGLTTQLLLHGRIKTTQPRAKAMRKYVDHIITLAKGGSLHQRRQALGFIYDKKLVNGIFALAPERYATREGGYTRIIRTMPRRGDNAPMAYIELVE